MTIAPTTELLSGICDLLNYRARNYGVFLRSYQVATTQDTSSSDSIRRALGLEADVGGIGEVSELDVITEIREGLMYTGDSGAGPDPAVLESAEFVRCIEKLVAQTQELAKAAKKIERFWLKAGHPAYPVFWDFAFLFTGDGAAIVLVGSSSD